HRAAATVGDAEHCPEIQRRSTAGIYLGGRCLDDRVACTGPDEAEALDSGGTDRLGVLAGSNADRVAIKGRVDRVLDRQAWQRFRVASVAGIGTGRRYMERGRGRVIEPDVHQPGTKPGDDGASAVTDAASP